MVLVVVVVAVSKKRDPSLLVKDFAISLCADGTGWRSSKLKAHPFVTSGHARMRSSQLIHFQLMTQRIRKFHD